MRRHVPSTSDATCRSACLRTDPNSPGSEGEVAQTVRRCPLVRPRPRKGPQVLRKAHGGQQAPTD